jgi:hypothetical protein
MSEKDAEIFGAPRPAGRPRHGQPQRPAFVEPPGAQHVGQRVAVDVVEDQIRSRVCRADLEDPQQQGVADAAEQRGLPAHGVTIRSLSLSAPGQHL